VVVKTKEKIYLKYRKQIKVMYDDPPLSDWYCQTTGLDPLPDIREDNPDLSGWGG
jgi:hypothetical protein